MATGRDRLAPSMGLFYCGMGVILAATVLNVAHDRLPNQGIETLPPFLANMYEMSGKLGVTLTLVTAGMSIILVGFVTRRAKTRRSGKSGGSGSNAPYLYTSSDDDDQAVSSSGSMVLQTRKYLSPQSALSGSTNFPEPRQQPQS